MQQAPPQSAAQLAYAQLVDAHARVQADPARWSAYYREVHAAYEKNYGAKATAAPVAVAPRPALASPPPNPPGVSPAPTTTRPVPAPAAGAPPAGAAPTAWPKTLEAWADRHMRAANALGLSARVTSEVFALVKAAAADGSLWTRDWDAQPPPPSLAAPPATSASTAWTAPPPQQKQAVQPILSYAGAVAGAKRSREQAGSDLNHGAAAKTKRAAAASEAAAAKLAARRARLEAHQSAHSHQQQPQYGASETLSSLTLFTSMGASEAAALAAAGGEDGDVDWSKFAIVGTCEQLEKQYFRLVAPPAPSDVRPEPTLRAALEALKSKYRSGSKYLYVCDQLKAIRQDLAVQLLTGPFTVEVYEMHARIALENGDAAEFNQCRGQLKDLWGAPQRGKAAATLADGGGGAGGGARGCGAAASSVSTAGDGPLPGCRDEFAAYEVLYNAFTGSQSPGDSKVTLSLLSPTQRAHPWVRHALAVSTAVAIDNWHRFFTLYQTAPNLGSYLMDWCAHKLRTRALQVLVKACRPAPSLPLSSYLVPELGFESPDAAARFITACGGVLVRAAHSGAAAPAGTDAPGPQPSPTPSPAGDDVAGGLALDCKASTIELVREASTEEAEAARGGLNHLLKGRRGG